ncbi:hypothetical protein AM493_00735 [Flavobacterium akiainvivens]|uniref:Uncharacterized protein n=1 Tax=Flavobacterium akiainvivens TaxID=1202724 RepID=A0A0M8MAQ2_9FLAO|nr:hypothetical protein [Flavobacterium akiainvivens]KOS04734.1 hypothetical protein AM493_00735 [Flavobacterium akiainvivens]SFQ66901.1 hypothetical protein SAMN05444144_11375 [Flavobacterium akiainvivens]
MKNLLILLFAAGLLASCTTEKPSDDEIYDVVNHYISTDEDFLNGPKHGLKVFLREECRTPLSYKDSLNLKPDSLFTKDDIDYITIQDKDTIPFILKKDRLKVPYGTTLISHTAFKQLSDSEIYDKYGLIVIINIGKPLFSEDHKTAVITVSSWMGSRAGAGARCILKKDGKGWKVVKSELLWIS